MSSLTCDQARLLLSDLLAGAGADPDAVDAHLTQCVACQEYARAACRQDRALKELVAVERSTETAAAIRALLATETNSPHRRLRWALAAAAMLLAVAATFWLTRPAMDPAIARLERVDGEVYVMIGAERERAAAGRELRAGQGLQTIGEESGAIVVDRDGRRLEIGPDSTLAGLSEGPAPGTIGNHVSFVTGSLSADVTQGPPMLVSTPQAQLVSQAARLSLVNTADATRVELETGSARFTRRSDGQSVELAAGTFSIARAELDPMAQQPLPAHYTQARASLPVGRRLWALAFSPDGRSLVTGGAGARGQVRLWDPARGAEQEPLTLDLSDAARALAFSRDGRLFAAGGDVPPLTRVWDWSERQVLANLPGHRSWIEALAFSADQRTLVVAGAHGQQSAQIHLWDLERRQARAVLDGHAGGVWCVTFSPDGQTLASSGRDGVIKLWDFERQQVRQVLLGHTSEVYALAFSPDGAQLVSSSRDKTVRLWDVATGQERHCLLGHSREIRAVAFAPDGRTVASASQDSTVRLWRVSDGRELATFKLPGSANAVAYSPDGRTLAAGGWYGSVQLWDLPAEVSDHHSAAAGVDLRQDADENHGEDCGRVDGTGQSVGRRVLAFHGQTRYHLPSLERDPSEGSRYGRAILSRCRHQSTGGEWL